MFEQSLLITYLHNEHQLFQCFHSIISNYKILDMIMMTVQNQNNRNFYTNMEDCLKLQSNCNSSTEILHIMKSIKDINVSKKYISIYVYHIVGTQAVDRPHLNQSLPRSHHILSPKHCCNISGHCLHCLYYIL